MHRSQGSITSEDHKRKMGSQDAYHKRTASDRATLTGTAVPLSISEKLQLLEDLWGDIASDPTAVPVQEWQKDELNRRKQNLLKNPGSALSWEEIQRSILT